MYIKLEDKTGNEIAKLPINPDIVNIKKVRKQMTSKGKTAATYLLSNEILQWVEDYSKQTMRKKSLVVELALTKFKNLCETINEVRVD